MLRPANCSCDKLNLIFPLFLRTKKHLNKEIKLVLTANKKGPEDATFGEMVKSQSPLFIKNLQNETFKQIISESRAWYAGTLCLYVLLLVTLSFYKPGSHRNVLL